MPRHLSDDDAAERFLRESALADDIKQTFERAPAPDVRGAHLQAMSSTEPVAGPAVRSRRRAPRRLLAGAVVIGGVLAGGSAMAVTGTLPDPIQEALADVGDAVGVHLPHVDGRPSQTPAAANKARSTAFTNAKKAWVTCVHEHAIDDDDAVAAEAACGEKPHPHDFTIPAKTPKPDKSPKPERTEKPDKTPKPSTPAAENRNGGNSDDAHDSAPGQDKQNVQDGDEPAGNRPSSADENDGQSDDHGQGKSGTDQGRSGENKDKPKKEKN